MADVAHFIPKRTIGTFSTYIVIEEVATEESQITEHPVQTGAPVTDHVFSKPVSVTIRGLSGIKYGPLAETLAKLRKLRADREPMDVVIGKAAYSNMVIGRLTWTNDSVTENIVAFTCELREVILVAVEVVTVPASERQANPAKTGATHDGGKKQAGEYGKDLAGPPDPVDSVLSKTTGVQGATSPFDFF